MITSISTKVAMTQAAKSKVTMNKLGERMAIRGVPPGFVISLAAREGYLFCPCCSFLENLRDGAEWCNRCGAPDLILCPAVYGDPEQSARKGTVRPIKRTVLDDKLLLQ